jgi:RNA polymerase sigma-70 factor (ECF subfamily)
MGILSAMGTKQSGSGQVEADTSADTDAARAVTPDVAAIFVANHRAFLAFLERRVGGRAIAEDILQEAFVKGMGRLDARQDESVIAWFYRTLRNAAVDHHRRHKSAQRALDGFAKESDSETTMDTELQDAVCQCVRELAGTLKPEYATALKRIEVDGVSVKAYADEVGISANNAAVRVFRAREALKTQVSRSCGTCADHGCLECTCSKPAPEGGACGHTHP